VGVVARFEFPETARRREGRSVVAPDNPWYLNTCLHPAFFKAESCNAAIRSCLDTWHRRISRDQFWNGHLRHAKPFNHGAFPYDTNLTDGVEEVRVESGGGFERWVFEQNVRVVIRCAGVERGLVSLGIWYSSASHQLFF
jgi:hypothetical protein